MHRYNLLLAVVFAAGLTAAAAFLVVSGLQKVPVEIEQDSDQPAGTTDNLAPADGSEEPEPQPPLPPGDEADPGRDQVRPSHTASALTGSDPRTLSLVERLLVANGPAFVALLRECLDSIPADVLAAKILEFSPAGFCGRLQEVMGNLAALLSKAQIADLCALSRILFAGFPDISLAETALTFDPANFEQVDSFFAWDPAQLAALVERLGPGHFTSPVVLFQIVMNLEMHGMAERTVPFAVKLLRLQPDNPVAFHLLNSLSPADAVSVLEAVIEERPGDHFLRYRLGSCLLTSGQRNKAFDQFREALKIEPGDPDYMQGLIEADPGMAAAVLEEESRKNPSDQEALGKLARAFIDMGRKADAFELAARAFEMEPDDPEWTDLMLRLDPVAAGMKIGDLLEFNPTDPVLLGLLGRARMSSGDSKGAFDAYCMALERSGTSDEGSFWAGEMAQADPGRASTRIGEKLGFDADCLAAIRGWRACGQAGLSLGRRTADPFADGLEGSGIDWDEEGADFRDGGERAVYAMNPEMLGQLGRAMIESGRGADGAAVVEFAMERIRNRSFHGYSIDSVKLAGALGRHSPARAMKELEEIRSTARLTKQPLIIGAVADAYKEMGREGEALQAYREALRSDPTNEEWITAIRDLERRW